MLYFEGLVIKPKIISTDWISNEISDTYDKLHNKVVTEIEMNDEISNDLEVELQAWFDKIKVDFYSEMYKGMNQKAGSSDEIQWIIEEMINNESVITFFEDLAKHYPDYVVTLDD